MVADSHSRLLAVLSHELRSPMGVLSGYLKLLEREPSLSERQQTLVRKALRAGDKLHDLLGELRDLLQLEAGDLRPERRAVPLQTLVTDVVTTSAAFPEAPAVHVGVLPNVVLQIDRARMTSALASLVRAAARPIGPQATVHFRGALDDGPRVKLTIGTGEDVAGPSEAVPLDESRGGMGLALPLSRAIITAHGGTVQEQADATGVTTFRVVLTTTD